MNTLGIDNLFYIAAVVVSISSQRTLSFDKLTATSGYGQKLPRHYSTPFVRIRA